MVHVAGLVNVDDVEHLGPLLSEKYDVLSIHLMKYVSSAAEHAEKGLINVDFFLCNAFVWYI